MLFDLLFALYLACQMIIGGQGGRGGESCCNEGGERGSAYDNGPSGGLVPGSGGGGGAGYPGGAG